MATVMNVHGLATERPRAQNVAGQKPGPIFQNANRVQQAITAPLERKVLAWLAQRTPDCISPDHLTALGFAGQFLAGASYALARWSRFGLLLAAFFIAVNWLGDSLDGTVARQRNRLRPRYGFYVDHIVDTFGASFLMFGLAASGYLHWQIAGGMLIAFLVLSVETYLSTYVLCSFQLSHGFFGPTEIRLLLIIGNVALVFRPHTHMLGREFLVFDVGGTIATAGMLGMAVLATIRHTIRLYREERLP
jgi:archaetidylinositol phosphate synthase